VQNFPIWATLIDARSVEGPFREVSMATEEMRQRAQSPRGDATATGPRATELVSEQGKTAIADVVVAKIAGIAAREVAGVHELVARGVGGAVSGLAQRMTRADTRAQGVDVEVGTRAVTS
jgi:hypothetical protein